MTGEDTLKAAMRVSKVSIAGNLALSVGKLLAGIFASSSAMISDAIHSASDVASTIVVMVGVHMAAKSADEDHPYGHERMECVASAILALFLAMVGAEIGISGLRKIYSGAYETAELPGIMALAAAAASIALKEAMFWYTRNAAKRINSGALMADAWHHRSDALSSIGALIGIAFARHGFPVMDAVASVVISLFIIKAAFDIMKDSIDKLVDHCADEEVQKRISEVVSGVPGVVRIDDLKTRLFGNVLYVDVEIAADGALSLEEAHDIAEKVHDSVEKNISYVKHCMVHVNPA
ncbi:MAG: cation transporter [Lachnospiraceae bacterium]|nr:cation transporter [Lachnospiraceae bacterium]